MARDRSVLRPTRAGDDVSLVSPWLWMLLVTGEHVSNPCPSLRKTRTGDVIICRVCSPRVPRLARAGDVIVPRAAGDDEYGMWASRCAIDDDDDGGGGDCV